MKRLSSGGMVQRHCNQAEKLKLGDTPGIQCVYTCQMQDVMLGLGYKHRLVGLVVKASASGVEDPGFESRLRRDFSGWSHTSYLKIDIPVATLPGAWLYRVSGGIGRLGVSIL